MPRPQFTLRALLVAMLVVSLWSSGWQSAEWWRTGADYKLWSAISTALLAFVWARMLMRRKK
jgi:hypothetical protein